MGNVGSEVHWTFSWQGKCPLRNVAFGNCRWPGKLGRMRLLTTRATVRSSRSRVNAWSGRQMLGADGNDSRARTACDLDDVVFASERMVTTPMEP